VIELEVKVETEDEFSLWENGREVGFIKLYETDHVDQVTSSSCVIIRRGHMPSALRDKHLDFMKRTANRCPTTKSP